LVCRRAGRDSGPPRRQRRRQDDDVGDPPRPSAADLRRRAHLWGGCAAPPLPRAAADQFFVALCRPAAPADGAAKPLDLRPVVWARAARRADWTALAGLADRGAARSAGGEIVGGPENPGRAGEGAAQRAGAVAA